MDYATYQAARERLRRLSVGEKYQRVYPYGVTKSSESYDKQIVYDAEHDSEPATVEWLREIGFIERSGRFESGKIEIESTGFRLYLYPGCVNEPTCGDVLTLLRVFAERKSTC